MLQRIHLPMNLTVDRLVAVPHADGENAAEEIQIRPAIGVLNELILGAGNHQRLAVVVKDRWKQEFPAGNSDLVLSHGGKSSVSRLA